MLDMVTWFGCVGHYQSQLAVGTQMHEASNKPGLHLVQFTY